uniref:Uncharacterized protein n=1 Tax=Auxenochlorella protothecoides TaxID=3075 RepID=A0A1D2A303_AUXPR
MNVRQEKGLSGLWVGMWRASSQSTLLLFVLPMDQQFVFLVGSAPHRRSILSGIAQRPASPCPGQRVQAFEVGWQGLVGMQYSNPLCSPGRLVLEARGTRRRTFKSMASARQFYGFTASDAVPSSGGLRVPEQSTAPAQACPGTPLVCNGGLTPLAVIRTGPQSDLFPCNAGDDDLPGVATQESSLNPAPPSPEHRWPPAASWTTLEQEYAYRTISISFEEETLPGVLSSVIMSEDRLLRLYESGLPGWAVLLPRLGIYYRPWVRRVTWILFYIFSIVSLAAGFYDLYRNLPGVQALFNMVVARFWGPSVLFRWLEAHAQVRLSLLLTFLLGKSEWLVVGVRLLRTAGRALSTLLGPHMAGLWGGACALAGAFTPALSAARQLLDLAVMPLTLALQTLLLAPLAWLLGLARSVRSVTGAALSLGAALLRASTRLGWSPGAAAAGAATGPGLAGLAAEVSLALRTSALTTASRAAHAVLRFILHLGELAVRHRHTLRLRAARAVSGVRAQVAAAAAPGRRAGGGAPPGRCAPVSSSARSAEARAVDDDTKPLLLGGQAQCGCTLHGHEE